VSVVGIRTRRGREAPLALALPALAVAAFAVMPVVFVVVEARTVSVRAALDLLWRPRVGMLLWHTLELLTGVCAAAVVIGVGAAWCLERTDVPLRRLWTMLVVLPIGVPEFVNSFGWISLEPAVHGLRGALLVTTLSYYPFVFLPVAAALRGADPALEETARSLGVGAWGRFWRITLPQCRLGVLGGCLIIALHLLAEYGAFATLRFPTFATEIFVEYQIGFDGAAAAVLSLVLVAISVLFLSGELRLQGRARYVRLGSGAARARPRRKLGRPATAAVLGGLALLVGLALGVPATAIVYWLVQGSSTTLPSASVLGAATTTFGLASAAALVTAALALPVAVLAVRHRGPVSLLLERSAFIAYALPGVVVALAFVTFSTHLVLPLYQSNTLLVGAYAALFLPLALIAVRASLAQAPPRLEEVARSLGQGPLTTFRRVTLPLIAPGVAAACAFVFLSVTTELTATLILRPTGSETLATRFWTYTSALAYGAAAPYALLMVLVSAGPTYLLLRQLDAVRR
jgi:iron(III) transport system permease protein